MKYLSLNNEELKELINLKKSSFIGYIIIFGVMLIASYFISESILPEDGIQPLTIVVLFAISYLFLVFYSNRSYFNDLLKKEKKVYKGVLSTKTQKTNSKYQFNMDGNIFVVDKETYEKFEIGDILEFHISANTKHLFKVEKVAETL